MNDEETVEIIVFLSKFCKFSIYGGGVILNVNDTYFALSDSGVAVVPETAHHFEVRYTNEFPKRWDNIIMHIRNGNVRIFNERSEPMRGRTIINKILSLFV